MGVKHQVTYVSGSVDDIYMNEWMDYRLEHFQKRHHHQPKQNNYTISIFHLSWFTSQTVCCLARITAWFVLSLLKSAVFKKKKKKTFFFFNLLYAWILPHNSSNQLCFRLFFLGGGGEIGRLKKKKKLI